MKLTNNGNKYLCVNWNFRGWEKLFDECCFGKNRPELSKLIAVTTRKKREQEKEGFDKYFLSNEQFREQKENFFMVHKMYGAYYGFKKEDIHKKGD